MAAGDDVNVLASIVTAAGNADITAGNDINIATETLHNRTESRGKKWYSLDDTTTNVASTLTVGGNLSATAGNDVNVLGSNVTATGNANLNTTSGDINIASVQNSEEHVRQTSKKGMFSSSSTSKTTAGIDHVASNLNVGGNLTTTSGQDVNVLASIVTAAGNADINAGNNINIVSGNDYDYSHTETKKSSLSFGFDKGSFNYAKMSANTATSGKQTNVASEVTAGGNVTATANRDVTVLGSNITADGDVNLNAGNDVHIAASDSASFNKSSSTKGTYGIGIIANENELGIKQSVNIMKDMASGANYTNNSSNVSAGNDVNVTTTRDTNILASNIAAGNDINVTAGRDLNIMSQTDTAESRQKHLEAEIGVKASVSQNISSALKSIGQIFTIGNPLEGSTQVADAIMSGELDGNRKGVEDAAKVFNAYNSAASGGGVDGGVYVYGQVAGSKSSTVSETHVVSNVTAIENITTISTNDTTIKGANIKAGGDLAMNVGGNMDVQSVQNTTDTDAQQFAGNIQSNLTSGGKISGGINVSSTEAKRAWVDDQTELTGGNSVNINVGGNLNNKGAVIANVDSNGVDQGNLQVAVGGEFTHSDIQDSDKSVTKGIGVSVGVNPSQDTGGVSGVSLTYNDSKKEGVTRATIGDGTITVGGQAATEAQLAGLNRDVSSVQQITFNEGMEATINVPMELIKDPEKYLETSKKTAYLGQINAFINGDRQFDVGTVLGIDKEKLADIYSGKTKVTLDKVGDKTYIVTSDGTRYETVLENHGYVDIKNDPSIMNGLSGIFLNGVMNSPEEALRNGVMQTGSNRFLIGYDPSYGLIPDLIEVGYNKLFGNNASTMNTKQDNEIIAMFNQQNPNAINAGHSAGGQRLYLANQANPVAFTKSVLEFNGAPVNEGDIQNVTKNVVNGYNLQNNSGDFVGKVLGNNANTTQEWMKSAASLPLLFTPLSPHSNYTCLTCQNLQKGSQ